MTGPLASRADLLRLIAREPAHERQNKLASLLGYEPAESEIDSEFDVGSSVAPANEPSSPANNALLDSPADVPLEKFWRVLEVQTLREDNTPPNDPQWLQYAPPLERYPKAPTTVANPPPALLTSARQNRLIKRLLTGRAQPRVDLDGAIRKVAERQPLFPLPVDRQDDVRAHWVLFIDRAEHLHPFFIDFDSLRDSLVKAIPDGQVTLLDIGSRDLHSWAESGVAQWLRQQKVVQAAVHYGRWLALSDLGVSTVASSGVPSAGWQQWLRFSQQQKITASVVTPLARLSGQALCGAEVLPLCTANPHTPEQWQQYCAACAVAPLIDRSLLRRLRQALQITDPAIESRLWSLPQAGAGVLHGQRQIRGDAGRLARSDFAQLKQRAQIATLLLNHFKDQPEHMLAELESTLASVGLADQSSHLLASANAVLRTGDNAKQRAEMQLWGSIIGGAASPRQLSIDDKLAALVAQSCRVSGRELPAGINAKQIAWLNAGPDDLPAQEAYLVQAGQQWTLAFHEEPGFKLSYLLQTKTPVLLELSDGNGEQLRTQYLTPDQSVNVSDAGHAILHGSHQHITLDQIIRPHWAAGITRHSEGLEVTLASGRRVVWRAAQTDRHGNALTTADFGPIQGGWWDRQQSLSNHDLADEKCVEAQGQDEYGHWLSIFIGKKVTMKLRWIRPGEFMMGSPEAEEDSFFDETQHPVILTEGFWLAEATCTQRQWHSVTGKNPARSKGDDLPVESVSWDDVQGFIEALGLSGDRFVARLPSEAQWEYACRAGSTSAYHWGDAIDISLANYGESIQSSTVSVLNFKPNQWGLYQMHGNVWEWCCDEPRGYTEDTVVDPEHAAEKGERVLRGGAWLNDGRNLRSANRGGFSPDSRRRDVGFRLALVPVSPEEGGAQQESPRSGAGADAPPEGFLNRIRNWFGNS